MPKGRVGQKGYKARAAASTATPSIRRPASETQAARPAASVSPTIAGPGRQAAVGVSRWFWDTIGRAIRDDGMATKRAEMRHGMKMGEHPDMSPHKKKMKAHMRKMKMKE